MIGVCGVVNDAGVLQVKIGCVERRLAGLGKGEPFSADQEFVRKGFWLEGFLVFFQFLPCFDWGKLGLRGYCTRFLVSRGVGEMRF